MARRGRFWKWYWRALAAYRGYKIVTHEVEAARNRRVAADAAAYAVERCREAGLDDAETERIAERAARTAVAELGEMATIARKAVEAMPAAALVETPLERETSAAIEAAYAKPMALAPVAPVGPVGYEGRNPLNGVMTVEEIRRRLAATSTSLAE